MRLNLDAPRGPNIIDVPLVNDTGQSDIGFLEAPCGPTFDFGERLDLEDETLKGCFIP